MTWPYVTWSQQLHILCEIDASQESSSFVTLDRIVFTDTKKNCRVWQKTPPSPIRAKVNNEEQYYDNSKQQLSYIIFKLALINIFRYLKVSNKRKRNEFALWDNFCIHMLGIKSPLLEVIILIWSSTRAGMSQWYPMSKQWNSIDVQDHKSRLALSQDHMEFKL